MAALKKRQKAKDLVALAIDEGTSDKERVAAAMRACVIITKYDLLSSPLDGLLSRDDDDTMQAAGVIFETLTDSDLVSSVKKIAERFKARRR